MQDQNQTTTTPSTPAPSETFKDISDPSVASTVVAPIIPDDAKAKSAPAEKPIDTPTNVANHISEAHNILIALSSDPSVDELAAAIGLSLYLDRIGKRATAIYSGTTPNALEFLKPEETFEPSADTLQDFVIALSKDKADHLRYRLDGDFVRIFITPYKARLSEEDLEFSYGDYNVDLVLALDVANGVDLDSALREHGRIMHDATIINITNGNPGKFGEIEWSDKTASSVSEILARLLCGQGNKVKLEADEATAFLTGIVAATNRFSNAKTTPACMKVSSRLMELGANQQLISKNITSDIVNDFFGSSVSLDSAATDSSDPTKLDIEHAGEEGVDESKVVETTVTEKESTLLADLKAAEASLNAEPAPDAVPAPAVESDSAPESGPTSESASASASEPAPVSSPEPSTPAERTEVTVAAPAGLVTDASPSMPPVAPSTAGLGSDSAVKPEKIVAPSSDFAASDLSETTNKYGRMLEDALAESKTPAAPTTPIVSAPAENPALSMAPSVATEPEINGVPDINYMPMPSDTVLPPPPTPPIGVDAPNMMPPAAPAPAAPAAMPAPAAPAPTIPPVSAEPIAPAAPPAAPAPLGSQPAMQDQVYGAKAADPTAFKIPGL